MMFCFYLQTPKFWLRSNGVTSLFELTLKYGGKDYDILWYCSRVGLGCFKTQNLAYDVQTFVVYEK